jgi:hypothetical protein
MNFESDYQQNKHNNGQQQNKHEMKHFLLPKLLIIDILPHSMSAVKLFLRGRRLLPHARCPCLWTMTLALAPCRPPPFIKQPEKLYT